jgi:hypothetical protein
MSSLIDWENTQRLHDDVASLLTRFPDTKGFLDLLAERFDGLSEKYGWSLPSKQLGKVFVGVATKLYEAERLNVPPPPFSPAIFGTMEGARYRDELLSLHHKAIHPEVTLEGLTWTLLNSFVNLILHLPRAAWDEPEETTALLPVIDCVDVPQAVHDLTRPFQDEIHKLLGLFSQVRGQLLANQLEASGGNPRKLITPLEFKGSHQDLVRTFLRSTPFAEFFELKIPFSVPEHLKIHTAVIAKTGWGKTQLLQSLILDELQKDDPPSMVILDSTGAMAGRIQRLAVFNDRLRDRLLIIDPAHSPSLNMFGVANPRLKAYSAEVREDVESELIALFNYIFASSEYDLSAQMGTAFSYAVRVILGRPGSTVDTLRQLLEEDPRSGYEGSAFKTDIDRLPEVVDFFKHHFYSRSFAPTRAHVARRLHSMIVIPAFRRMFTADANVLDLYSETQEKSSIIVVNTNQQLLKDDGSILFGRYIIARCMAAAFERAAIPEKQRRITHLFVDEAAPYFDDTLDSLLTRVRQFGLKVCVAFQHFDQLTDTLRNSVIGQTSVKYVGALSYLDQRRIAHELRCEPEFMGSLEKDRGDPPAWSQWAVHADGYTRSAVALTLPFYSLENQPAMTESEYLALVERNRARVRSPRQPSEQAPVGTVEPTPREEPPDPGEPSDRWGD